MTDSPSTHDLREAVAATARELAAAGLVQGTAGNVSARAGDRVAITATGLVLAGATARDVTVVDLDGQVLEGDLAPTSELDLHLGIYAASPAGAVVHAHPPFATTLSLVVQEVPVVHYEQLLLGGAIRVAPFQVFGSPALAEAVRAALQGRKAAIMANHGAVAWGTDLGRAARNALLLEWICGLYWRARAVGTPAALTLEQQGAVVEQAMRTGYGAPRKQP